MTSISTNAASANSTILSYSNSNKSSKSPKSSKPSSEKKSHTKPESSSSKPPKHHKPHKSHKSPKSPIPIVYQKLLPVVSQPKRKCVLPVDPAYKKPLPYVKKLTVKDDDKYDLYANDKKIIELKEHTYDKIFTYMKNQVISTAKAGETDCVYLIPPYVVDELYPHVNVLSCANYIVAKITNWNENIKALFVEPNIVVLNWIKTVK